MSGAPDYIEPIVGWRTWLVVPEHEIFRLRSIVYDTLWSPHNELVASCLHHAVRLPWRKHPKHVPPARNCACGIYAAREPEEAAAYLDGRSWADGLSVHRVIGTVSLWGRVVECTRGWRGSRAYPKRIYVPPTRAPFWLKAERVEEIALDLTDYDVPVELLDADSCDPKEFVAALDARAAAD
ncbi:MAG: hypothetical protein E6G33_10330 [Actinobacteria bacterium]|nr:MAG: hypothetical protein E6G33_10330 [Actinomycetota bacterium]